MTRTSAVVTVTFNPSLDRTLRVESLRPGAVHRALETSTDPGGKGVNVARALSAHGAEVLSVLPVGGATGAALTDLLVVADVPHVAVPVAGRTRANVSVVELDGTTTKINEPGTALSPREVAAITDAVISRVRPGDWVVTAGSLAPGQDPEVYAALGHAAHQAGAFWAVDTSGEALIASLAARPDLVKPNREELGEAFGSVTDTLGAVVECCRTVVGASSLTVVCSLGADGAVLVDRERALHGTGPRVQVVNTVGAGDALLAGYLFGITATAQPEEALRTGIAWATAAITTRGTGVPAPELVRRDDVRITEAQQSASFLLENA